MNRILKINIVLFFILIFKIGNTQNLQVSIEHFSINDGLSQNTVNCVFQDSRGFLWFGTQDGLNKFDGYTFINFRHVPDDKNTLSSNYIRGIVEDKDSILWIATQNGLNSFNFRTQSFKRYVNHPENINSLKNNDLKAIYIDFSNILSIKTDDGVDIYNINKNLFSFHKHESDEFSFTSDFNHYSIIDDKKGFLWMGSKEGLISFNRKNEQFFTYPIIVKNSTNNNEVFAVYINSENEFFAGTSTGLFLFNTKTKLFSKIPFAEKTEIVTAIFEDNKKVLWIGTENGLMYFDKNTGKIKRIELINKSNYDFGRIISFYQDNSEILWIASDNGIFKIDRKEKKFKYYQKKISDKSSLSSEKIYSISMDNVDNIWLGTRTKGLNILNRKTGDLKVYNKSNSILRDDNIHCIYNDGENNMWLGTSYGVFIYNQSTKKFTSFNTYTNKNLDYFFKNNRISNIIKDSKGIIWVATFNGLLRYRTGEIDVFINKRNSPNEIVSNELLEVIERKNGSIWIASSKGVSKFIEGKDNFINFTKENSNLSNNSCLTVFESKDKTLWVGTETGLDKFDDKTNTFKFYTSKSTGFVNDYIYEILEDDKRHLWLSTNKGIITFNPFTQEVQNYNIEDGLQSYEFNVGASFISKSGEMFFGGVNGFNSFFPDSIYKNPYLPNPLVTRIIIKGPTGDVEKILGGNDTLYLKFDERSFDIYFALPEYTYPSKNEFKYRVKEIDSRWVNNGYKNFAGFIRLSPGEYTFELEAANSDNQWNYSPVVLKIIIYAPWWRTKIAISLYLLLIVFFVVSLIARYNKNIRKENKILQEKNRAAKVVERQKELLTLKNQNISDSIRYAKRIIEAMMPAEKYFKRLLPNSFVLFKPKDIVSGDFYWIDEKDDKIFVAAVDCTGHGVPGAFMSIIGLDLLRNILSLGIETPAEILIKLNNEVAKIFKREDSNDYVRDGMDLTICAIDKKNKKLEFSGAINPLFIVRDDNIIEIKSSRTSIGPEEIQQNAFFENHVIDINEGDMIYMFSDGYVDQFGGTDGKKYKFRRFRHLLLNIYKYDLDKQKNVMNDVIDSWKGSNEQVDDILVIGIRPL